MRAFTQKQKQAQKPGSSNRAQAGHASSPISTHPVAAGAIQNKLAINKPGDEYEREADRISEQVMRMPGPQLQRACVCGGGCPRCQSEQPAQGHGGLQAKPAGSGDPGQAAVPSIVGEVLSAPGQPLDTATRNFMESHFGHDFSRVRVHTSEAAAASTKAIGARAYAYGSDVVFGKGQFSPHTYEGRRLLAHELAHVVQRPAGALQLKPDDDLKPTQPTLIKTRPGNTDRIEDAYGAGSLDETQWRNLLDVAEQAFAKGQREAAQQAYLALYADIAKLAQATRVLTSSGAINVVTGSKNNCKDAKPGLNLSMDNSDQWGANATTAFVDANGTFGVKLGPRGALQPEVAIVLSRSVFVREKEQALGRLRHEMVHAEHDMEDASATFRSDPKAKAAPVVTSEASSELLAYVEGFMTMFHLTHPAPNSADHPAFVQLLGALDTGEIHPWAEADPGVRSEALGRLQEFYCHALDGPHRDSFEGWVDLKLADARRDRLTLGETSPEVYLPGGIDDKTLQILQHQGPNPMEAAVRIKTLRFDFFSGLQRIITSKCKGLAPTKP